MALIGGTFGDNAATGTTAVSLATILGSTREEYRQVRIRASSTNLGIIFVGDSGVSATDAYLELDAGEQFDIDPHSFTAPAGGDFKLDPSSIYIIGTAVADQAFVAALL